MARPIGLPTLKREVRRLDPSLKESDEAFGAALVLLSLLVRKPWQHQSVAKFVQLPRKRVARYMKNLRDGGVISRGKLCVSWTDGGTGSGIAFWLDVAVATGYLRRDWAAPLPEEQSNDGE